MEPDAPARIDYAATLTPRAKFFILAGVLLSLLLAALDQTIVSTALPRIAQELHGLDLLAWTSTAYLLASTTMVPVYGRLSDTLGRRTVLLTGITIFLGASALCGLAPTMRALVFARALQGLGGAALTSTAFAVPADLFTPAERPRYQGLFGAVFTLASIIGPPVGGLLTDHFGWRSVFYINLPVGLVAATFVVTQMPALKSGLASRVDWAGALFLLLFTVPFLLALRSGDNPGVRYGLFALALAGLVGFIVVERRNPFAIIPFDLFRSRVFACLTLASAFNGATFFSVVLFLSLFVTNALGLSATSAGTVIVALTLPMFASALVASQIVQRTQRYRAVIASGVGVFAFGIYLLGTMTLATTLWGIRARLAVVGMGLGPAMPLFTLAIQNAVSFDKVGVATATRQFFQQLGQAIGSAVFGLVLTSTLGVALGANLAPVRPVSPELRARFDHCFDAAQLRAGGGAGEGIADRHATLDDRLAQCMTRNLPANIPPGESLAIARAGTTGVRASFARAVTHVYVVSLPLALIALVLVLLAPELPLRKSNRGGA